jgi:site-specific recombinase XerC
MQSLGVAAHQAPRTSPNTSIGISGLQSVAQAQALLHAHTQVSPGATRAHLEASWATSSLGASATVWTRYTALQVLYCWLQEEDEVVANPMARMKPPIVTVQPILVPQDGLRQLFAACAGKDSGLAGTALIAPMRSGLSRVQLFRLFVMARLVGEEPGSWWSA